MKPYAILPYLLQAFAWPFAHVIFRMNGTFTVHGREHLKDIKGPMVFAANHVNDLDPVVTRAILPFIGKGKQTPLFWVARFRKDYDALADEPFEGWRGFLYSDWFFRVWGAYPAYRGTRDYGQSLRHHLRILKDGYSVCIFPQGGKAKLQGREAPVRGGAVFLAHEAGVPLIPIAIRGTRGIDFRTLFFKKTKIEVRILPPVQIPDGDVDYKGAAQKVMDSVYNVL